MMADYERFKWRETQAGLWARDIDEVEASYASVFKRWEASGRSFFHMTGHLSLKIDMAEGQSGTQAGTNLDEALKKAWVALRYHHPNIAARTKLDRATGRWIKEYSANAEGWLDKTFVFISGDQSGKEWANSDPPAPPLPTLNVLSPPPRDGQTIRRDLVFRSPHDTIDGIGTLLLLDNYVRLAAVILEKGESYQVPSLHDPQIPDNLSPPYRVAAAVPAEPSEAIKRRLANLEAAEEADSLNPIEHVSLPHKKGVLIPGVHKRVELVLSPDETQPLLMACKNVGATVTHVFHAAIALVLRDMQDRTDESRPVRYVNYLLRNERGSCHAPFNDHRHPTGVYHSISGDKLVVNMTLPGQPITRDEQPDEREEFLRIVKQMKSFYTAVRDDPDHYALAPHLWAKGTSLPTEADAKPPPIPPPTDVAPVSISSMGRIDNIIAHEHGPIETFDPWVTGEELRNGFGLFLGTFRGSLSLSAAYNDAWHDEGDAVDFLRKCMGVVKAGFGS